MSHIPEDHAPGLDGQVPAPIFVSQHVCALVAASAARTAALLGATPDEIALAVATAVHNVALDVTRIGATAPTPAPTAQVPAHGVSSNSLDASAPSSPDYSTNVSNGPAIPTPATTTPPAFPVPDVNFESSADASTTDASTFGSNSSDAATGQSYASSTDVSSNSLDASADTNIPVPSKNQRRRQRRRQRQYQIEASTNTPELMTEPTPEPKSEQSPVTPQHFNLSANDSEDDTNINEKESAREVPNCLIRHYRSDCEGDHIGDGLFNANMYEDVACTLTDDNIQQEHAYPCCDGDNIVDGLFNENVYENVASTLSDYNSQKESVREVPDFLIRHFRSDCEGDNFGYALFNENTYEDVACTLTDYNIQQEYENTRCGGDNVVNGSFNEPLRHVPPIHPEIQARLRELLGEVDDADGRTLSDHSIQSSNESHESNENSLANNHEHIRILSDYNIQNEPPFSLERYDFESHSRCANLESKRAGTAPGATHDPGRGGARPDRDGARSSDGDDPGAAAHGTAAPSAGAALLAPAPRDTISDLLEKKECIVCMLATTRDLKHTPFVCREIRKLENELESIHLAISEISIL